MAEIAQGSDGGKGKAKKMSTRIDMTPMVDLGFLLITFFVLVTTFSKPSAMDLAIPAKPDPNDNTPPPEVKESRVLQIALGEDNKLYWYRGVKDPKVEVIDFSQSSSVRPVIQDIQQKIKQRWGTLDTMLVLIKPMKKSNYKNMVDILDELSINKVKYYALMDFKLPDDSITIWKGQQPGAGANSNLND
ncbi:MAG: ExbD/TolR family protein [Saprospiraceae bacterium]